MNLSLISLEMMVVALGLLILLVDLWLPLARKRQLGYLAAAALTLLFVNTFTAHSSCALSGEAFGGMFVQDGLAVFFKRMFLLAAIMVLIFTVEYADRVAVGISEYYALILFALTGMLFAASANNLVLLYVAIELITVTFFVLVSFTRGRVTALEAGVKYLIIGALSSAFMVYGLALVWGITGKLNFNELAMVSEQYLGNRVFQAGVLLVLVGIGFKIVAFPFHIWAPDVYQGAPSPSATFLAFGSKTAGFVLLLRFLFGAVPAMTIHWEKLLLIISAMTILYGNLGALPQRNLQRLLGYSSISHAGYLLLGVAALTNAGQAAVLYYLGGYLFTTLAAFAVIVAVLRHLGTEDIGGLAGLHRRSPLLAVTLALAMISLAGIPPLVGFFGKFLLFKAVIERGADYYGYYYLAFVALVGVVISLYYYFGVVKAIYFSKSAGETTPIVVSWPLKVTACFCIVGMLWLGTAPNGLLNVARRAVGTLAGVE